jgi:threonine aldolase
MKKGSTSLAIKEKQIKTMLRFHFIPVRMAIIENTTTNVGKVVGKKRNPYKLLVGL